MWPKVARARTETWSGRDREFSDTVLLQRYSSMERVTGIELALAAWELFELKGMCLVLCEFLGPERPGVSLGCLP